MLCSLSARLEFSLYKDNIRDICGRSGCFDDASWLGLELWLESIRTQQGCCEVLPREVLKSGHLVGLDRKMDEVVRLRRCKVKEESAGRQNCTMLTI